MNYLSNINNSFESYQKLISFYEKNKDKVFEDIEIQLTIFFSANLSAVLGALLDLISFKLNDIHLILQNHKIEEILLKNDFLAYFGKNKIIDNNHTTIKYLKLNPKDGKFFKNYVINEFIEGYNSSLPKMSKGVKDKIVEAIYEIFVNSQIHSETKQIYTCGQSYPNKHTIEFTIVDTGIGFKDRINKTFNSNLTAVQAIEWAVQDKNTSKKNISGGIGLAILKEFVTKNNGKMQIISSNGFYQLHNGIVLTKTFSGEFPGTIVNLEFNTNDNNSYKLLKEIKNDEIF